MTIVKFLGVLVYLFYVLSYLLTCILDPGVITPEYYIENNNIDKEKEYNICNICQVIIEPKKGIVHCPDCEICIIGNDHHCPWSSKCVGKNNIFVFRLFLVSVFLHLCYLTFASLTLGFSDIRKKSKK